MLADKVTVLNGLGKQRAQELAKMNICTIGDLLQHFPYRYEDRSQLKPVAQLQENSVETIIGVIVQSKEFSPKRGLRILNVQVSCPTGEVQLVWFNQSHLKQKLQPGLRIVASGKVGKGYRKQINVQDFELLDEDDDGKDFQRIVPVYRGSEKINSKWLRKWIEEALEKNSREFTEYLPADVSEQGHLVPFAEAMQSIHFPAEWSSLNAARYRLVHDEFLSLILGLQLGTVLEEKEGIAHSKDEQLTGEFIRKLPFTLTHGQKKVILEIKKDMEQTKPMHRLLQGDVGSGKTVVAIYMLLKAVAGGYQGAMMAPTEILAEQHYLSLQKMLADLPVKIVLLKSSMQRQEKEETLAAVAEGTAQIIIGTHALIQKQVEFAKLGAVIIDEQHRFGVKQRLALENKGITPDVLVMTATPIPRSLALTLYGDMDLSIIDERPPGRQPVKTYCVGEKKRAGMYQFIAREIEQGYQVYVVCPLVEESEKMDLENVTALAEQLAEEIYPEYSVGLLHGKMPAAEKAEIMEKFRERKIDILVATTVIEVGVDVPNANIMVIENAERFGLAQLHQLRGRVGRGKTQAHCFLMAEPKTEESKRRIGAMVKSDDGFVLAEEDLLIRGTGEVLGTRQHGLPDLKIASLVHDLKILEHSKKTAEQIIEDGLEKEKYAALRQKISRIYEQKVQLKNEE